MKQRGTRYTTYDLKVEPKFADYLAPVGPEETEMLERDLIASGGPREPLVVWKERQVLVGGHRRYAICKKHGLPYYVEERSFINEKAAMQWMLNDQVQRRNMTPHERAAMMARHFKADKLIHKYDRVPVTAAVEATAQRLGVTKRTVFRSEQYMRAIEGVVEEVRDHIIDGVVTIKKEELPRFATLPEKDQRWCDVQVRFGRFRTLQDAMNTLAVPEVHQLKVSGSMRWETARKQLTKLKRTCYELQRLDLGQEGRLVLETLGRVGQMLVAWRGRCRGENEKEESDATGLD